MKLLVSPINTTEAKAALDGGADIVDVKNPKEGSLGANFPWMIRAVIETIESKKPVSATIGDFNFKPGTASLAALGAADHRSGRRTAVKCCAVDKRIRFKQICGSSRVCRL